MARHCCSIVPGFGAKNVARHTSHVTRHTSHVSRHTSHVTRHTSHVSLFAPQSCAQQLSIDVLNKDDMRVNMTSAAAAAAAIITTFITLAFRWTSGILFTSREHLDLPQSLQKAFPVCSFPTHLTPNHLAEKHFSTFYNPKPVFTQAWSCPTTFCTNACGRP